jgi:hypothetical protein
MGCTLVFNAAVKGGGVFLDYSSPQIQRTILAFNVAGGAVQCVGENFHYLECCDVYGNNGGDWSDCIEGMEVIDGNFSGDPLFCDSGGGDFTLRSDSPCLPGNHPNYEYCYLIGAYGEGCSPPTAGRASTWGRIKARFR